ncbi:sodium-coupled monocarboxylate transporter 1-like [Haliotis rubra]|uniref:sodium-coupled monocarboxylate transporter 1-like n=1 Tax=Haliotis rubra TaxID=36100 RepID=UPI001EE51860|nr:sodium-coupled monocarboxylate transporter 1-like [Haliotis rubra]
MATPYSIQTGEAKTLGVSDFLVCGASLAFTLGIGLAFAIKSRKSQDPSEFLVAGRSMGVLPVTLSLVVTFISALTLLGLPTETYIHSTMFWWLALAMLVAVAGSAHIFNPVLHNLGITSAYEMFYLGSVLYAPSLALKTFSGLDMWVSILSVGCLVTLYTSVGGMKAVLWTDSFQAVIILVGLLSVVIQGSIVVGGFGRAWEVASQHSRINFQEFSVDPRTRLSFWSVVVGGGTTWMAYYSVNQCQIQRVFACPSLKEAQMAMWLNGLGLAVVVSLCCMIGVLLFAFYEECDPLQFNLVGRTDELVPLFVMDILGHLPGLPGIFLSCVFSGCLSTLSSGINALSGVLLQDFIRPHCARNISSITATVITKLSAAVCGFACIGLAFLAGNFGNMLQLSYIIMSVFDGPVFGVFILGMFFPRANKWGAICGYMASLAFTTWISVGAYVNGVTGPRLPLSVHGCNWNVTNTTMPTTTLPHTASPEEDNYLSIYRLSFLYYTASGAIVNVTVGVVVSLITGYWHPVSTDPELITPIVNYLYKCRQKKPDNTAAVREIHGTSTELV